MKKINFRQWLPHLIAILVFLVLSVAYFSPIVFDKKDLPQGDVASAQAWGKDLRDYHEKTGDYAYWSNAMFSGMPANYAFSPPMPNIYEYVSMVIRLGLNKLHLGIVFLYLIGFYILLMAMGVKPWLGIVGAIAYAFASYNLIIIDAGHVNQGLTMATMAPVIGGIILTYRKKYLIGALTTLVFTGLQVFYNHQQISYYLLMIIIVLFFVYLFYAIREKTIKDFFKASILLVVVATISILPSLGRLITIMDYTKETMRGGAVLKNNPNGEKEGTGLDVEYAFQWSYGTGETWSLMIPNVIGGSSHYNIGTNSECYKALKGTGQGKMFCKYAPTYWGTQPPTSGPVYAGAIVCFLFVLGLLIVKGREKWWLLIATMLSIILAWGRNFAAFNEYLFYNLPMYSKFRTPAMALVIAGITMAILAILAIKELIEQLKDPVKNEPVLKKVYIAAGITGGFALIFALFGGSIYSFSSPNDTAYPEWLSEALQADRRSMLTADAWRSFAFILFGFALIWAFIKYRFKANFLILGLGALILVDLWIVDHRFLGEDSFVPKKKSKAFQPTEADMLILQDKDPDYRVINLSTSTFMESNTSYFHKSIGGYSPVKLRRYQDIIDYHLSGKINPHVLDMLNTRYVIVPNKETGGQSVQKNPGALGNAWFVDTLKWVSGPDEEIIDLTDFNPAKTAIIDQVWKEKLSNPEALQTTSDSAATIALTNYSPGNIIYSSSNPKEQLAVFSEVFYKTWHAYIDGKEVPIIRANYILRAVQVPAGIHTIEFKCIDPLFKKGQQISLIGSIITGVSLLLILALLLRNILLKKSKT